ncbi:MAG: FAD-binding oxidoreductase [Candidatus Latescibacterota bacterium]|nr:FAD-binding oxidoreductase [Candidatus Latescibacterota bacterium]
MQRKNITGWGRFPVVAAIRRGARSLEDLVRFAREREPLLAQGSSLSYGDASLSGRLISALPLNRLLSFDSSEGVLCAEAGITLEEIIRFALPRGWFLPVTPGTKFVTLGGCICADVHGKNHHVDGSIGSFVREIHMVLAGGTEIRCSPQQNSELFEATVGGMGLTGFVYAATVGLRRVQSAFLQVRTEKTSDLESTCRTLLATQSEYTYSVAWIDTFPGATRRGRGLVMLGRHAPAEEGDPTDPLRLHSPPRASVPDCVPAFLVNRFSGRVFNALYYRRQWRRQADSVVHYDPFFYPLDALANWNRLYGRGGFLQYQFVVPFDSPDEGASGGEGAIEEVLGLLARRGFGSTLAVLKTFGPQRGLLSFPTAGLTLALDFPLGNGRIVQTLDEVTKMVVRAGGRVYLAKDAVVGRADFEAMFPRLDEFRRIKQRFDPDGLFRSVQSDRLGIT